MKDNASVQSLDRGIRVLELLAEHGEMTGSAIAAELGLHPSSSCRLLRSLSKAGLVRKPRFHSFALDYGMLLFAGKILQTFPLVPAATIACNRIMRTHGYLAIVGILFKERRIYLTKGVQDSSIVLIDDQHYPLHASSVGRLLVYRLGRKKALEILRRSIKECKSGESAETIYEKVDASVREHGFLFMENEYHNTLNAAQTFDFEGRTACLAVYSETAHAAPENLRPILDGAIKEMQEAAGKPMRRI